MVQPSPEPMPLYLKPRLFTILVVACALTIAGFLLVSRWAQVDLDRDLKTWQDKLNIIADGRSDAVSGWVNNHFTELKKLAANPSLQIYFAELQGMHPEPSAATPAQKAANLQRGESDDKSEPAQKAYLRNLLVFTADRMGFAPPSLPGSLSLHADIPFEAHRGIAVVDMNGGSIVSTPYMGDLEQPVRDRLAALPPEKPGLIDMFRGDKGVVSIGFAVPVYGIQADPASSKPIARIVGVKPVGDDLFKLLRHPQASTEKTLSTLLVRHDGDNIVYLSPLSEGGGALEKTLAAQPDKLAEAFAVANPGSFGQGRDYQNNPVLFTSRAIPGTPWTLLVKIDTSEAMAESQVRRSYYVAIGILLIGAVVLLMFAVWYFASSRRALMSTRYFKNMAAASKAQEVLLRLVSNSQRQGIYILDKEGRFRFSNTAAAENAHMQPDEMTGKQAADVLGAARAQEITDTAEAAMYNNHAQSRIRRLNEGGEEVIVRAEYIPLEHIPIPGLPDGTPGVLVVEQDISEVVHERERRLRLHHEIIDTLISIVDKRDPHAANHSALVSQIAYEVATNMGLDAPMCDTVRTAGSLMNIGKIIIPTQLLTKQEDLSEEERRLLKDSLASSAALLKNISFEGPVVETLEEVQEQWDGAGPQGLKEEGILVSARIIAVVNAFVGMISARSYRAPLAIEVALKTLLDSVDTLYDRKVVVALANYIDNQGGKAALEQMKAA